jgi:surfeit locus 1 family protein
MTRRSRRLADLVVALMVLALLGLGTWQVQRLHWKEELIAARDAALTAPPLASWQDAAPFRRIRVEGNAFADRAVRIGLRERYLTPVVLDDGTVALVEAAERFSGRITVVGHLRESEKAGAFTPENDRAKGQWYTADVPAIARALGLDRVRPYWVATGPAPVLSNDHLQYAATWYSLAVALVVIYILARRRQKIV